MATSKKVLKREPAVEMALGWAHQNGYSNSSAALDQYCESRAMQWTTEPYYNYVIWQDGDA